ncbi:MAG: hypothetical protein MI924_13625 [Chloroflexales bacterium]|nr:hypothetical protein [Chloroflexales bacterium]
MNATYFFLASQYDLSRPFNVETDCQTQKMRIVLAEHVLSSHKARLSRVLQSLPAGSVVEIDGTWTHMIDRDVLDMIYSFKETAKESNIRIELTGIATPHLATFLTLQGVAC